MDVPYYNTIRTFEREGYAPSLKRKAQLPGKNAVLRLRRADGQNVTAVYSLKAAARAEDRQDNHHKPYPYS